MDARCSSTTTNRELVEKLSKFPPDIIVGVYRPFDTEGPGEYVDPVVDFKPHGHMNNGLVTIDSE